MNAFFLKFVKWKSVTNEIRFNYLKITVSNLQHVLNKYLSSFMDSDILYFGFLWIFPFPFHALLWIFSSSCCGSLSHVWLFVTPWTAALQASLSFTISRSLLKLMSIKLVMPSSHLILCCPLLLLPSIFPSIRVFSIESALHIRWPKYRTFSLSISPSKEYSGLISFRTDLLAVQRTLKSLIQHHSLKASVLWCSAFFMVQLSHP